MNRRLSLSEHKSLIALAGLLILIAASAVGRSGWTERLDVVSSIALGAIVVGLLISRSLLPTVSAHLFSLIIGAGLTFGVVERLLPSTLSAEARWQTMIQRISGWLNTAINGGISYDNLMFVFQMGLIVWLASYLSIWLLFRSGKVWASLIPTGVILLIVYHYAPGNLSRWVFAFLFFALLTIITFNLKENERRWHAGHIHFRADIGYNFFKEGLIFSTIILVLAWFAPVINSEQAGQLLGGLDRQWREAQTEWNRLFANLNYKPDPYASADTFGQTLSLGGPRQLTAEPVMTVDASAGYYWRAVVFDEYNGANWKGNDQADVELPANKQPAALPFFYARQAYTQTYTLAKNGASVLYAMANPVMVNRNALGKSSQVAAETVDSRLHPYWAGQKSPWFDEITYIQSNRRLRAGESYTVVSLRSTATLRQLQNDDLPYPDWIRNRYLQLPPAIPQRVFDLAGEITANASSAYDKATAIETYLRENITYNAAISAPPVNREKVDYILFDLKEGYCDYYASAMVVMLRSQGLPARLAAGYAGGEWQTTPDGRQIRQVQNKDAHSWVEVFFGQYGWIEFEPTASQPVIIRQEEAPEEVSSGNLKEGTFDKMDQLENVDVGTGEGLPANTNPQLNLPFRATGWGIISAILLIAGTGLAGWLIYMRLKPAQRASTGDSSTVNEVYEAMLKLAAWMGLKKHPAQTPYEHARLLNSAVPAVKTEVDLITGQFVRQNFSRAPAFNHEIAGNILSAWASLRPRLYKAIFERRNLFNWLKRQKKKISPPPET